MTMFEVLEKKGHIPVTVFRMTDRIHLGNYKELEAEAQRAFDNGMRDLIADLSQIEVLTSIGIRALVIIHKMLSKGGGSHLRLAGVSQTTRDILDIAGITQFIELHNTVEEAVASF